MDLSTFKNEHFDRGASKWKEFAWLVASELLVASPLPGSAWRACFLRVFGAMIATGVVLKPRIRIKFPWRLMVGENSWIGEGVWIDNLATVSIGRNVCISQGAYLCTGNHDWSSSNFDLITSSITIEDHSWVGARATLAPGTHMLAGAVIALSGIGSGKMEGWTVYAPGRSVKIALRQQSDGCNIS